MDWLGEEPSLLEAYPMTKQAGPTNLIKVPQADFDAAIDALRSRFGVDWLSAKGGSHPLQQLWCRGGNLAIGELYTLGTAIVHLSPIDEGWVRRQVATLRAPNENNRRGAAFELLAASIFCNHGQQVEPAPKNTKGFDLDVGAQGHRWRISLKAFSTSEKESTFRKRMAVLKKAMDEASPLLPPTQWLVQARAWPTEADWSWLHQTIRHQLAKRFPVSIVERCWDVRTLPLPAPNGQTLDPSRFSYTLVGLMPYHANEQKNFASKPEDAVANLSRHVNPNTHQHPVILMRVPPTASVELLKNWVRHYLDSTPQSPLELVWFLQPYVASDSSGKSWIAHHFAEEVSAAYLQSQPAQVAMEIPLGTIATTGPAWILGGQTPVGDQYIYQAGRHHVQWKQTPTGYEVSIAQSAPGIETVAVVSGHSLRGRWGNRLLLIGE